jgi:hypothetical protein
MEKRVRKSPLTPDIISIGKQIEEIIKLKGLKTREVTCVSLGLLVTVWRNSCYKFSIVEKSNARNFVMFTNNPFHVAAKRAKPRNVHLSNVVEQSIKYTDKRLNILV